MLHGFEGIAAVLGWNQRARSTGPTLGSIKSLALHQTAKK
ncbi:hypothetical protein PAMC26577_01650 [Caballeronia sordidicola]|uniref:Uncharacterized protein n=1 Tax=Caballeronia sordidicola TaxID=196367 RepID=A0A242N7M2_CABSO|nr:hypothetical protein PAMC26577_01650 [Caballeronia sordidicola]